MRRRNLQFKNADGLELSARLTLPATAQPHNYALFAHCFTCNKNLKAVNNISLKLTQLGFGVLSFDFTGLGSSQGTFSDTNFSSNVDDLVAAAGFLEKHYQPPTLLIGHSLGGAAVIFAAAKISSAKAIATISAPANPVHVAHLIQDDKETIENTGKATVNIGGRPFLIKKQFLDDLQNHQQPQLLQKLRKALLILHAPQDTTVSIDNAAELYQAAHHPKSFISLDGADHLLSEKEDSTYAGQVIASWARRYLSDTTSETLKTEYQTVASLSDDVHKYTTQIKTGHHYLVADEPEAVGGNDFGPSPYQLLAASLGACTAMTLKMYAQRKGWELDEVEVHLDHHKKYVEDCQSCEKDRSKIDHIDRVLQIEGNLDQNQKKRLLEIADRCPVHRTLQNQVIINTRLEESHFD